MAWELTGNAGIDPATNFLGTTDNEPLIIRTNGTEHLRITPDGNVGIGTANPGATLDIRADVSANIGPTLRLSNASGNAGAGGAIDIVGYIGASQPVESRIRSLDDGNFGGVLAFYTKTTGAPGNALAERMRLDSSGNVGIGTADPICKLTVSGVETTPSGGGAAIQLTNSASGGTNWYLRVGATGTDTPVGGFSIANVERYCLTITRDGTVSTRDGSLSVGGSVTVGGDIILTGADCAEEFDMAEAAEVEPGTVVVLDQDGVLYQSQKAYDKRVAGVISGAGDYKPGLILDRQQSHDNRVPVALVGKVYCKVDAQYAPIEVGDLLTTSPTAGHAMKADNPVKAFGSVIGKALRPLETGQGLVPILIALQ